MRHRSLIDRGRYREALTVDDEMVAKYPGSALAHAARGFTRVHLGDFDGAEADLTKATELDTSPSAGQLLQWERDMRRAARRTPPP